MKTLIRFLGFIGLTIVLLIACTDKDNSSSNVPYNPNDPIEALSFYPDTGGMASKVILSGKNFGTDPSMISLYFNKESGGH